MNSLLLKTIFFCLFVASISCTTSTKKNVLYYPVDSLINAQVGFLTKSKALLAKKAEIDGTEETISITPSDSAAWAHELDIFSELNVINNPVNAGNYIVENGVKDSNSNLTIRSFTGKETLPVVYLKIFYLETPAKLKRVEALYREENSLLKGSRLLILEFQEINNKTILTSYSIEGSQKMFLGDSVKFSIKGTITIP
jgi:hypothetical protein